jgi:AcrR family transcriptional regulator
LLHLVQVSGQRSAKVGELFTAILETRGGEVLALVQAVAQADGSAREALDRLIDVYIGYFVEHPAFLRMHLRSGASWALGPALATAGQIQVWQDIHALHAGIFRRGVASGEFVDEDPEYLAKLFTVMDQVLLAEWVAGGMKAGRERLVERLRAQVERSFYRRPEPRLGSGGDASMERPVARATGVSRPAKPARHAGHAR